MKTRFLFINLFALCLLVLPLVISAQVDGGGGGSPPPPGSGGGGGSPPPPGSSGSPIRITIDNPVKGDGNIYSFITLIIDSIVLPLGGVIAVLYIMYAGFLMVTARGDAKQVAEGRTAFTNAAIGTAILLGAWVIAKVIEATIDQLRAV
jgi:hypothetical protein